MSPLISRAVSLSLALLVACGSGTAAAQGQSGRSFGEGPPFDIDNLPPGRLRSKIETLPAPARERALEWFGRFDIPLEDVDQVHADDEGALLYVDAPAPEQSSVDGAESSSAVAAGMSEAEAFALHSRPGAPNVIFLDFDGHVISGTVWNSSAGVDPLVARSYNVEGASDTFSQTEVDRIAEIWHRVAEDFAPFDVDVTTEDPGVFDRYTARVLITTDTDAAGVRMPYAGAGGVAYIGVFGGSSYGYYSPALVYYNNLGGGAATYTAEAASHEMGHNNGLSHDGTTSGSSYYAGHGSGLVSWAPIMGNAYSRNVTQWSRGEYPGANNTQDDLAILAADFGYALEDHADTFAEATPLLVDPDGTVHASNPETDPDNLEPDNKGVIDRFDDVDVFYFDAGSGVIDLTVTPAWDAFYRTSRRGANLDAEVALYDQSFNLVDVADPVDDTYARISRSVPAGRYYLAITGKGSDAAPYSDYASAGMFFVQGTVPVGTTESQPPSPSVMGWASPPSTAGTASIAMTAVTATDVSGGVEYYFECSTAGGSCADSGWQASTSYLATGLAGHTTHSFRVKARDAFRNENGWSTLASATTANSAPVARSDTAAAVESSAVSIAVLGNDMDPDGDALALTSVSTPGHGSAIHDGATIVYTPAAGFTGEDSFSYVVSDGMDTASATVSVTVDADVAPPEAPAGVVASAAADGNVTIGWTYTGPDVDGFEVERQTKHKKRNTWSGTTVVGTAAGSARSFTNAPGSGTFRYRIRAINAKGAAQSAWSAPVTVSGGDGGGGGGKCHPKRGC